MTLLAAIEGVAGLARNDQGRHRQLRGLLLGLATSMLPFEGARRAHERLEGALRLMEAKGLEDDHQDSYYEEVPQGKVDPAVAAKGLGEAGRVKVAETLWRKMVRADLLQKYKAFLGENRARGAAAPKVGPQGPLREMLESIRTVTNGAKRTVESPSTTAFLIPKNVDKCCLMVDPQLNDANPRKPRKSRLPTLESLGRRLAGRRQLYMTKTDLRNCY